MFVNLTKILRPANKHKFAVGAFNFVNMEVLQSIIGAANKTKSPVIIQTTEGAIDYAGLDYLYNMAKAGIKNSNVPVCLHLDHGKDLDYIKKCIKIGYSSVMFDGSHLPYEENIKMTKRVVRLAHKKRVSVEAEIGTIGGTEDKVTSKNIVYADPDQAVDFIKRTGCNALALGIGTSHGAFKFKGKAKLRLDILKEVKHSKDTPLVLHGASGTPKMVLSKAKKFGMDIKGIHGLDELELKRAIKAGIVKVNNDTDLRLAFSGEIREQLKNKKIFDMRKYMGPARQFCQELVEHRMKVMGSNNKARYY